VAKANVRALQEEMTGVCNVATGRSVTLLDLIDALSSCVNRTLDVLHLPAQAGDIPFSEADCTRLQSLINHKNMTNLQDGLQSLLGEAIPS